MASHNEDSALKELESALAGCLVGTAVGDAIGLPFEGISRRRQHRMLPSVDRHRFLCGRGMISDDTEHTCMVAQALISSRGNVERFTHSLAWRLRLWLLGLPAGVGLATLRSIIKMWIGFPLSHTGVYSAGNGPAMRSSVIGVAFGGDPTRMHQLVRASTRLTHTDPRAEQGALAIALAAFESSHASGPVNVQQYLASLRSLLQKDADKEFMQLISQAAISANEGQSAEEFSNSLGLHKGITGFVNHTVPVVIQVWLRNQGDYRAALKEIIRCGGDTDTTAAILGGIIGARVRVSGIPEQWRNHLMEWPRSISWMQRVAYALARRATSEVEVGPVPLFWPALLPRNIFFLCIVLLHGFRRLLPPY